MDIDDILGKKLENDIHGESGLDIQDAGYLKRLFDKQMDKVDPKLSHEGRVKAASDSMDSLFAALWRDVVEPSGVQPTPGPEVADGDKKCAMPPFRVMVQIIADREGLGEK